MKAGVFSIIGAVVLVAAALATAGPAFTLPPVITEVSMGGGDTFVTVDVGVAGPGAVEGLNFYLEVETPLEILSLQIDGLGTMFGANSGGAAIWTYGNGGSPTPQVAFGSVITSGGTLTAGDLPVAIATIKVPAGTVYGDYWLTTDLTYSMGMCSDWAGDPAAAQATGFIRIPEPVCALLVLAGLPLLRRWPASPRRRPR